MGGWVGEWGEVKVVLRIAYSNKKELILLAVSTKQQDTRNKQFFWSKMQAS